jgi:cellulose synthase (UDP-forming)
MNLHISVLQWLLFYSGFYVMQVVVAFFTLGSFRYEVLMLATVSFPIYVKALWNVMSGKDVSWHVTGKKDAVKSPFNFIIPQVLFFTFFLLTSFVAIWRDEQNGVLTLATVWNILNTLILFSFLAVAAAEGRRLKGEARASALGDASADEQEAVPAARPMPVRTVVARPLPRPADSVRPVRTLEAPHPSMPDVYDRLPEQKVAS